MNVGLTSRRLEDSNCFPGHDNVGDFVRQLIEQNGFRNVADIGGGANPVVDTDFIAAHALDYTVLDVSADELAKAPAQYKKVVVDLSADPAAFDSAVKPDSFDFAFTHMFMEHIRGIGAMHRNIHSMLRPGGIVVHMFPSSYNIPLAMNRMLPEWLSLVLVKIAQRERDISGKEGKFPAYYKDCGPPTSRLGARFKSLGYDVVLHKGYVGHSYYDEFPVLPAIERALRKPLIAMDVALVSQGLVILQKR